MLAFLGYVNSLVVQTCILRRLPNAIFSQGGMVDESQEKINEIAAEDEDDVQKREQNERNLNGLKQVLERLKTSQ